MDFKNKRVLVTGGSRGLGKAVTMAFARQGARVGFSYLTDDKSAEETRGTLSRLTDQVLVMKADVSSSEDVENMARRIQDAWGGLDVLVNNAGILRDTFLLFLKETDWDRVLDVNLKGTYLCSRAFLKGMISQKSGRIINLASPSALTGRAGQTNYAASKGGIISFTKSLSKEVAKIGITVNALCPGVLETNMTHTLDPEVKSDLLRMIPMGRFGDPEEVAETVLFLASRKAGYMTGQVISVDGGLT
jgi:3-oxoacyl-[acyl-carrier protein] reductase